MALFLCVNMKGRRVTALFFCVDNNSFDIYLHMEGKLTKTLREIIHKTIEEGIGQPTPQQLIPDDEEELWRIIQSLPENHSMQFTIFNPQPPKGLTIIFHGMGNVWAVTALDTRIGQPDGKWHKATEILLRSITTEIYALGEYNDVYYSMVETIPNKKLEESMFPKDFNRHNLGTCMSAAALATAYFLAKGITNFKIVEGWVSMYPNQEENEWSPHTWIEFDDGRKFDPTKKQWEKCGFKVSKTKYEKITRSFTPEEYVKICKGDGSLTEIRLEPPVDNEVRENVDSKSWSAWWMEPNGTLHEVYKTPKFGHWLFARNYVIEHGLVNRELAAGLCVMTLFNRGWVRLSYNYKGDNALHFDASKTNQPNEKIMAEIKNLAIDIGASKITNDNTNKDINVLFQESMFPKGFNRHDRVCGIAAAYATMYLLNKRIHNFKVIEGTLNFVDVGEELKHTWIKFNNGKIFDPTKKQFKLLHNFDMENMRRAYEPEVTYTPEEYIEACKKAQNVETGRNLELLKKWAEDFEKLRPENQGLQENMSYDELLQLTAKTPRSPEDDTNRIDRSKTVNVRSLPVSVEENNEQWNFRYKSSRVSSVTDETFEGHITFLKGEVGRNEDATMLECKVDCGCPDYMYKFAYNNYAKGAGDIGPGSENNAINRRPKPAYDIGEGLCKHLVALSKYLDTKLKATKTQNIFEAMNEVAKQGPFNVTYYD